MTQLLSGFRMGEEHHFLHSVFINHILNEERFTMHLSHHPRSHRLFLTLMSLLMTVIVLNACGANTPAASTAAPQTPVSIQLAWTHEYSSASFYAAEKNGHFAAQNLDVRLDAGGFASTGYIEPIAQVVNGTVDFGVTGAAGIIQARAEGKPVVAVATILQRSPLAILSLANSGIRRPQDLVGRRIAVADGGAAQLFHLLLKSQHIDPAALNIVPRVTFGIDPLMNGEVDAMVAWVINEGVQLSEAGINPNVMMLSDYGVDSYEMVLFTSEKMIAEHPGTVKGVVQSMVQGTRDVVDNPNQAATLVLAYNDKLDLDGQRRRIQATLPLLNPPGVQLGMMQPAIWKLTYQMMLDQNVLTQPIDLDRISTTIFLDPIAGK
jgi:NitT/TauT family transport system substrate-binding protein